MHYRRPRFSIPLLCRCFMLALTSMLLMSAPVAAQDFCEDPIDSVCVSGDTGNGTQAFEVTLVSFDVDQQAGTSIWDYEVCDLGPLDPDCSSDKSLSHLDILLGDLSACLNPQNDITFTKLGDTAGDGADLTCVVEVDDPSCSGDEGLLAKCDVEQTNPLDPGDCVVMRLTIAGETAGLGTGVLLTKSKAGPECTPEGGILGPSCQP